MQARDIGNAVLVAFVSIALIVGALSISLVEFAPQATPTAANNQIPSPIPLTATPTPLPTLTPTIGPLSPTPSSTPTFTNTALPPASCLPPSGWGQIIVQAGDTLGSIAARYRTSMDELRRANCLLTDNLVAGTVLYAPPVPTTTPAVCSAGAAGWVKTYKVKFGDTFFSIATKYYTTANQLKSVNCRTSDLVYIGETLWVPNVAPRPTLLPGNTATPTLRPTDISTETDLPFTITALPFTATIMPTSTSVPYTLTVIPTLTAVPIINLTTSPIP